MFVRDFLAFSRFDQSQHFFHLLQCLFQRFNYLSDFINSFVDGDGGFGDLSFFFFRREQSNWSGCYSFDRLTRVATAPATTTAVPSAGGIPRLCGTVWFRLLFFRKGHFFREHGAPMTKSNPEIVRGYFFTNNASEAV